jgi:hypothetical protein
VKYGLASADGMYQAAVGFLFGVPLFTGVDDL